MLVQGIGQTQKADAPFTQEELKQVKEDNKDYSAFLSNGSADKLELSNGFSTASPTEMNLAKKFLSFSPA